MAGNRVKRKNASAENISVAKPVARGYIRDSQQEEDDMFKVLPVTAGNFAGLWCITRTDALAAFVGSYAAIQKIRESWIASGLEEKA